VPYFTAAIEPSDVIPGHGGPPVPISKWCVVKLNVTLGGMQGIVQACI